MTDNSTLLWDLTPDHAANDRRRRYLYCTARPGDDVPPASAALLAVTFWARPYAPRERMRWPAVVSAAVRLPKPQHPGENSGVLRRLARLYVRDILNLPGSPIVRTHAEWEARSHA